jgi:REP element-mobilizing transposase RayT
MRLFKLIRVESSVAHDILLFATWKTWLAAPLIDVRVARQLQAILPLQAAKRGVRIVEAAMVPTHVHVVIEAGTTLDVPMVMQSLKGASARLINRDRDTRRLLRWERGYDVRSVGRASLPRVRVYLDRQGEHHGLPLVARWSVND